MGKQHDLTKKEKQTIVKCLGDGITTLGISKSLQRDHRTIKLFVKNSQKVRKRNVPKNNKFSDRDLARIKREVVKNPKSTSKAIFAASGITAARTTRCRILNEVARPMKTIKRPPLTKVHKQKRLQWASTYMKTNFENVLFTDEMRATLDGPDGWDRGWVLHGSNAPSRLRRQQGGGGVMIWAGIIQGEIAGPFKVEEGVKMNSVNYTKFLEDNFLPWYRSKPASFKKKMIFMQDNAPSHASNYTKDWLAKKNFKDNRLMIWPPASPDLNPIEHLWSILKRELYANGRQFSSKKSLWEALLSATQKIDSRTINNLTSSVDSRLVKVLQNKGDYIHM